MNVSWLLGARKDTIEKKVSKYVPVCKGLSTDDVRVSRDTVFQKIRPGALVLKPAISSEKSWEGGYRRTT